MLKNKGYAQLMLSSFFLIEILQVIAHFGYNPVTVAESHHVLVEDYPNIVSFLTGQAEINNSAKNKMKTQSNVLPSTFFHRILFLYYIYMNIPATVESNYEALSQYYNKQSFFLEGAGQRFKNLNILKFSYFFKNIYNFERIERDDDNYNDEYKRLVAALNLIDKSNFFIPDDIEETNTDELHDFDNSKKPDQLELTNKSQHDILLHMFSMVLYDNNQEMFAGNRKGGKRSRSKFNVTDFYKLFQTILNVTTKNNPTICPEPKEKQTPKETNTRNNSNDEDADYEPNDEDNEE